MTSNVNNQAIAHLGTGGAGGRPWCGRRNAHISVALESFKSGAWRQCARCAAKLAKSEAKAVSKARAA
jgi:hypothetical protein